MLVSLLKLLIILLRRNAPYGEKHKIPRTASSVRGIFIMLVNKLPFNKFSSLAAINSNQVQTWFQV